MARTVITKKQRQRREEIRADGTKAPEVPENRFELKILQAIRRIMRSVDSYSKHLMVQYELTTPQLICLLNIIEHDNKANPSHIAREIFLSPSTIIGILDRLEQRGLIKRERDKKDRRLVNVSATAKGKKLAEKAPSPMQDSLATALRELPAKEQATIVHSLNRIVELMEIEHLDASPILDSGHAINKSGQKARQK